jgi:hypothetical protein
VAPMDAAELRAQWAFGALIDVPADYLASIPVPISREAGLAGNVSITYASVATPPTFDEMVAVFSARWGKFRSGFQMPVVNTVPQPRGIADYVASVRTEKRSTSPSDAAPAAATDPISTASTRMDRDRR